MQNIQNIFIIKTNNTKQHQRKTKNNKTNNLSTQITNKKMKKKTNKNAPTNKKNSSRIINKTKKFIIKIIILRKNKLHKQNQPS